MEVCLKNLPHLSAQQVYDHVAVKMLEQGERSWGEIPKTGGFGCKYRGPKGLKCAAGHIITDEEYHEEFEGKPWYSLVDSEVVPDNHSELLGRLQAIHDGRSPGEWYMFLADYAIKNGLSVEAIVKFKK